MAQTKSSSAAQMLGLLVICILALGLTGLFGVWYLHREATGALERIGQLTELLDAARQTQVEFKIQVQTWKNILIRGQQKADFDMYSARFEEEHQKVDASLDRVLAAPGLAAELRTEVKTIRSEHEELLGRYRQGLGQYVPGDPLSIFRVDESVRGIDQHLNARIDKVAAQLVEQQTALIAELRASGEKLYHTLRLVMMGVGLLTLACAGLLAWQSIGRKS
jgi:methyl-accepting chemotaxis protein-1 (serine sensor receptor)